MAKSWTAKASNRKIEEEEEDDIHYLTGKPFFDVIILKSHLRGHLLIPGEIVELFPGGNVVPVVLRHGGKNWHVSCNRGLKMARFDPRWKTFVVENNLKLRDACVFELMDNTPAMVRFKVHILRGGDMGSQLLGLMESRGNTFEEPICID